MTTENSEIDRFNFFYFQATASETAAGYYVFLYFFIPCPMFSFFLQDIAAIPHDHADTRRYCKCKWKLYIETVYNRCEQKRNHAV